MKQATSLLGKRRFVQKLQPLKEKHGKIPRPLGRADRGGSGKESLKCKKELLFIPA